MPAAPSNQEPRSMESVHGTVERVTFHNEENGFAVLRVKGATSKTDADFTIVGNVATVVAGEFLTAEGDWVMDPTHGKQFKAQMIRTAEPDSPEGIEKFLGSGLVEGIGPVYAKKIVDRFGRDVLDVIEKRSGLLEEVDGIGPTRRKRIKDSWNETKAVRGIMTFLMSHGISTARALRIYKAYGEQAMQRVQANPYCLVRDIRGIGFKTADAIARNSGIDEQSPLRAKAGVEHVLQELSSQGHSAIPRDALLDKGLELLGIDHDVLASAIEEGLQEKRLRLESRLADDALIYLAPLYRAETELAADLDNLLQHPPPCTDIQQEKALEWVQTEIGFTLAPAQQAAVRAALTEKILVITGGPGVGKTTIVNAIIKIFHVRKQKVVLAAPTGRAAKRMSENTGSHAMTLHRLLAFDPEAGGFKHDRDKPLKGDVFILDEASMLDVQLAHQLVRAIPKHAALVFVGDQDQLPSVGPGSVLKDLIVSPRIPVARLDEIFRQAKSSAIVTNAHRINRGEMPFSCSPEAPGDFYIVSASEPDQILARVERLLRGGLLQQRFHYSPLRDTQILVPMQRGALGAQALNSQMQEWLNPASESVERFGATFRVGDRVMQMVNNYDKDVFNGDGGHIEAIDRDEQQLFVHFGRRRVAYAFNELDDLSLSYAITIHKSQGSEYPVVILPLHTQHFMMLQRNLLYTAVTRGKKLVIVVGPEKAMAMALQRQDSTQRIGCLPARLLDIE